MPTVNPQDLQGYIGKTLEASEWFTISQERINQFAEVTLDTQFIHVDPEKARRSLFGTTIAHGFLTLSLLTHLSEQGGGIVLENAKMGVNYGFDRVRFLTPVASGKRIRSHFKLIEVNEKKGGQFQLKTEVTLEIEGEETPALIAEWLTMYVM